MEAAAALRDMAMASIPFDQLLAKIKRLESIETSNGADSDDEEKENKRIRELMSRVDRKYQTVNIKTALYHQSH